MDAKTKAAQLSEAKKQPGKGGATKGPLPDRTVIDEDLITSAVKEERMTGSDTVLASELEAEVDLHALETLSLSFSNILKIDNLQGMERLVKLQLDNNHIEKIEGLDHLVNLQWLDLSFNKIRKIEGLSALTKLTDLSLFSNELERVEGLETLRNLHVLSVGNNRIKSLEEIKGLRQFRGLRLLNVKGNPVCSEHSYQITVLAFLPQLKYLDYELIEPSAVAHARDKLLDQLHVIEEAEQQQAVAEEEAKKKVQDAVVAKAANVDGVQSFFDTLLREDSENPKLRILPDYDKVIANYRVLFQRTIEDFLPQMYSKHTEKVEEKKMFERALEEARKINVRESIAKIDEFDSRRKKAFALYSDSMANGNPEPAVLEQLNEQVQTLYDDLMDLEMLLVEQTNDIISTFEDSYSAIATANVNRIQNAFRCLEDVANHYVDALQELVATLTVKSQSEHFEAPPEVNAFLADKDTVKSAVTTSHDNHLNRIVAKSDELQEREDKEAKGLVRGYKQSEYERNRHRVSEIFELVERHKKLIREKLEEESVDQ